jgi:hypothetical protein
MPVMNEPAADTTQPATPRTTMKAVAVLPGQANSVHLAEMPRPHVNREYFEIGVKDMAQAEAQFPGWFSRLLTHPVRGLDSYRELINTLNTSRTAIKVFCEVAPL